MNFEPELIKIVTKLEKRKEVVTFELRSCPKGFLSYERTDNKTYLIAETKVYGKRKRHKLTRDRELAEGLLCKALLEDELKHINAELKALKVLVDDWSDFNIDTFIKRVRSENPAISSELIHRVLKNRNTSAWATADYNQSSYKPEEKKHTTSRGLPVRSKSELLIAEKLYEYDIDFRYEQIIFSGDNAYAPDFFIRRKDGKEIIWEHEGLTNDRNYLDRQLAKHKAYAAIGYTPWNNNFIVTYDTSEGEIDLRLVETEIITKLIV